MHAFSPRRCRPGMGLCQRLIERRAGIDLSDAKRQRRLGHQSAAPSSAYFYRLLRVFPDSRAAPTPLRFAFIGQDARRRPPPRRVKELNMEKTIFLVGNSTNLLLSVASILGQAGYAVEDAADDADCADDDQALQAFFDVHACPCQRVVPGRSETASRTVHRRHRTVRPSRPPRPTRQRARRRV